MRLVVGLCVLFACKIKLEGSAMAAGRPDAREALRRLC